MFLLTLLATSGMRAQYTMSWEEFVDYVQQSVDHSSAEDEQAADEEWLLRLEELQQLTLAPLNINTATKEELLVLSFLSEEQIDDIREYITRYHGMKTLSELQLVRSLSYFERSILPLFIYVDTTTDTAPRQLTFKEMLAQHKHEWLSRLDIPLYHRDGYLRQNGYRGARIYNRTKYTFKATKHLQAGFHFERDGGERGIDSYGGQLMLKDIGHIATLIAGDYKVGFGEGLVLNQGFSMGKSLSFAQATRGLKAMSGTDEYNFMRGAGATVRFGDVSLTAFVSRRRWDATLDKEGGVKTIIGSGYHRTDTEWQKRNGVRADVVGGDASWSHAGWHAGASGYMLRTSLPLMPGNQVYRQIYPTGNLFGVAGVHYGYASYRWQVRGETAYSTEQGGLATLHTLSFQATPRYRLTASQRYYGRRYYSFYASALSDNGKVQNETGATLRLDATPIDGLQLTAYADCFYNPWPRYGLTHSSGGAEGALTLQYALNRHNKLSARYAYKNKEYSSGQQGHHRLRLQWISQPSNRWKWQTTAMLHNLKGSCGAAIGETMHWDLVHDKFPLRSTLTGIYFYTQDYNSRVYLYEPNVVQSMSIPSFYGHGMRVAGTLRWSVWQQRLHLEVKYGFTQYFDRSTQSSGLQTIYSRYKNDITLQMRLHI